MTELPKLGLYRHFKGKDYKVFSIARDCDNPEKFLVIYKALYESPDFGKDVVWARPLEDFTGTKTIDNKVVKRFEFLGD